MTYLIDTDWIADWLKMRPSARAVLRTMAREGVAISLITVGEIYEGIYYGADPEGTEAVFLNMLRWVETLPPDDEIMRRFARLRGELRRSGRIIPDFDILIAATALHHDLVLVTRSRRFDRIPGLRLYDSGGPVPS